MGTNRRLSVRSSFLRIVRSYAVLECFNRLLTVMMADSDMLEIMKMFQHFTIDSFGHSYVSPNVGVFSFVPSIIYIS